MVHTTIFCRHITYYCKTHLLPFLLRVAAIYSHRQILFCFIPPLSLAFLPCLETLNVGKRLGTFTKKSTILLSTRKYFWFVFFSNNILYYNIFLGVSDSIEISKLVKDRSALRNEVIGWALETQVTDLIATLNDDFFDKIAEAKIKPNALTSEDLMAFAFSPRETICQSNVTTKLIVSDDLTQDDVQVPTLLYISLG